MDNGCPQCEQINGLCLDCQCEQADADVVQALTRREVLERRRKRMSLEKKLINLVNSESAENESNTPDWILGQYLMSCLRSFNMATQLRETWYGRKARPTEELEKEKQNELSSQTR